MDTSQGPGDFGDVTMHGSHVGFGKSRTVQVRQRRRLDQALGLLAASRQLLPVAGKIRRHRLAAKTRKHWRNHDNKTPAPDPPVLSPVH